MWIYLKRAAVLPKTLYLGKSDLSGTQSDAMLMNEIPNRNRHWIILNKLAIKNYKFYEFSFMIEYFLNVLISFAII